jgi:hypothetical protein
MLGTTAETRKRQTKEQTYSDMQKNKKPKNEQKQMIPNSAAM